MKLNWGAGIAIFYALFVVGMVGLVVASSRQDPGLVAKNYYEADLGAQKTHDRRANAAGQDVSVKYDPAGRTVELQFPQNGSQPTGSVRFLRPSDAALDFSKKIETDTAGRMLVPTAGLRPGLWRLTVDWEAGGRAFEKELPITF